MWHAEGGEESGTITWEDKAVNELLDRSKKGVEEDKDYANEYLDSFKVASYTIKEDEGDEEDEEEEEVSLSASFAPVCPSPEKKSTSFCDTNVCFWELIFPTKYGWVLEYLWWKFIVFDRCQM